MRESHSARSFVIEDLGPTLKITVPNRKNRWVIFNSIMALGFGIPVELFLLAGLAQADPWMILLLLAVMALMGILIWLSGYQVLMWQLTGKEVVYIDNRRLVVKRQIDNLSREKVYQAELISNLHSEPAKPSWMSASDNVLVAHHSGMIVFEYDMEHYRWGNAFSRFGIVRDEVEAQEIIDAITRKFPQYQTLKHVSAT